MSQLYIFTQDFGSPHVAIILVCLSLILLGMFAGMIWNFVRILSEDKEELEAATSREKSLDKDRVH